MKHLGDITKISGADVPLVDVVTFGAPCQDLSVAGLRKGMLHTENGDEETTRSGLFFEAVRIIKEMRQQSSGTNQHFPRYAIYENVPGALSSNNGRDWQAVLTALVRVAEPDAPEIPLPDKNGGVDGGPNPAFTWEMGGLSLIDCTTLDTGAFPNGGKGFAFLPISTGIPHHGFCLMLNYGEHPWTEHPSKLSWVLEENPDPKYNLSAKACQGILNRAERRGHKLPPELEEALREQSLFRGTALTETPHKTEMDGSLTQVSPSIPPTGTESSASRNELENRGG